MDARRSQVYNALFESDGETLTRITEDRAISLEDLKKELESFEKPIFLVGDGSKLCYNTLHEEVSLVYPPAHLEMQRASGVAMAAATLAESGGLVAPGELTPNYLRLSQAERERLQKLNQSKGDN
jgi:tRNA threonylcarbamoyladenosine biosynthesis protein TsaB